MKKDRFNPKQYQNKSRVEKTVATNVVRVWAWNSRLSQYEPGAFLARRWEARPAGGKMQIRQSFGSLEDARAWQSHLPQAGVQDGRATGLMVVKSQGECVVPNLGPTFGEVYSNFYKRKVLKKSIGTQHNYDRYIRLYFQQLFSMSIRKITSRVIDEWIDWLHESLGRTVQSGCRVSFGHELSVLRCVLKFYASEYDDDTFVMPLKDRHAENIAVREARPKHRDLTEAEFEQFICELAKCKFGKLMAALARFQYEQAVRISEAAGLFHEDVVFDRVNPEKSIVRLCRHVFYPRRGGGTPSLLPGFKNSHGGHSSVRTLHLFPAAHEALLGIGAGSGRGLVFGNSILQPFTYRQIQQAYDIAFKKAGLPYRGTHILRHGGAQRVLNETEGGLTLAQMVLGHEDMESTLVYAKRSPEAFRRHVEKSWSAGRANARKAT